MMPGTGDTPAVWLWLLAAWLVALVASLGALFIGEVMGQAPCALCWYQRAFMFPLAVVLAVASWRGDAGAWRYAMPLAGIGMLIAGFHTLQFAGMIPQALEPCTASGPSCSGEGMTILGNVPIPALALAAFSAIFALLLPLIRRTTA